MPDILMGDDEDAGMPPGTPTLRAAIANLRRLADAAEAQAPGTETHLTAMHALDAAWRALRDDDRNALLAAAARDLDRQERLVFGPWIGTPERLRAAIAVDGALYWITATKRGFMLSAPDEYGSPDGVRSLHATEAEAIEQARAHDRARRGGK